MSSEMPTFGIITCSDTRNLGTDMAGDALEALIAEAGWTVRTHVIVRDEIPNIAEAIRHCVDDLKVDVVLTCGGSGLSPRDVTPEATRSICEREVPGIAEAMRAHSLAITPNAMLSRAVCMQRGRALVINLPGSTKAATENWEAVAPVLVHAIKMTKGAGHDDANARSDRSAGSSDPASAKQTR